MWGAVVSHARFLQGAVESYMSDRGYTDGAKTDGQGVAVEPVDSDRA